MNSISPAKTKNTKKIIKKCHCCGQITEAQKEIQKCVKCQKSFLPLNYFEKIHSDAQYKYDELFADSYELEEEDLIKGLYVIW